jgi:hypothetical protein
MAWDAYTIVHVPRERELIYLNSENGRTLVRYLNHFYLKLIINYNFILF